MYNPPRFKSENTSDVFQLMDRNPFATVISVSDGKPMVSHLPLTPPIFFVNLIFRSVKRKNGTAKAL